jgi:2-keto-3-deoxy-L-rhamnonate aldolase RhmA
VSVDSPDTPAGAARNHVKDKLNTGATVFGTWITAVRTPSITRMVAAARFDFAFIDAQHSSFSWETIGDMCEMARASDLVPIVRPFEATAGMTNRLQDLGAMGVMFPDVSTPEEVVRINQWMRYPPQGTRGHTSLGPATDHRVGSGAEMQGVINAQVLVVIQIESREGVAAVDSILGAGPVDIVEIGCGDLSVSLGVPFETRHPDVLASIDRVVAACDRLGVAAGVNCPSVDDAKAMMSRGIRCISYSTDRRILATAYESVVRELRSAVTDVSTNQT